MQEVASLTNQIRTLESELQHQQQQVTDATAQKTELSATVSRLKEKVQHAKEARNTAQTAFEQRITALQSERSEMQNLVQLLETKNAVLQEDSVKLHASVQSLFDDLTRVNQQLVDAQSQWERLKQATHSDQERLQSQSEMIAELHAKLAVVQSEAVTRVQALRDQLNKMESELTLATAAQHKAQGSLNATAEQLQDETTGALARYIDPIPRLYVCTMPDTYDLGRES